MIVKDSDIIRAIEELGEHYRSNINNKYIKKAFLNLTLDISDLNRITGFTEKADYPMAHEYGFAELYENLLALARFIREVNSIILPNIRALVGTAGGGMDEKEKIIQEIAVNNFPSNLGILSDMVHRIFLMVYELDKESNKNSRTFFSRNPDLKSIGQLLINE